MLPALVVKLNVSTPLPPVRFSNPLNATVPNVPALTALIVQVPPAFNPVNVSPVPLPPV